MVDGQSVFRDEVNKYTGVGIEIQRRVLRAALGRCVRIFVGSRQRKRHRSGGEWGGPGRGRSQTELVRRMALEWVAGVRARDGRCCRKFESATIREAQHCNVQITLDVSQPRSSSTRSSSSYASSFPISGVFAARDGSASSTARSRPMLLYDRSCAMALCLARRTGERGGNMEGRRMDRNSSSASVASAALGRQVHQHATQPAESRTPTSETISAKLLPSRRRRG